MDVRTHDDIADALAGPSGDHRRRWLLVIGVLVVIAGVFLRRRSPDRPYALMPPGKVVIDTPAEAVDLEDRALRRGGYAVSDASGTDRQPQAVSAQHRHKDRRAAATPESPLVPAELSLHTAASAPAGTAASPQVALRAIHDRLRSELLLEIPKALTRPLSASQMTRLRGGTLVVRVPGQQGHPIGFISDAAASDGDTATTHRLTVGVENGFSQESVLMLLNARWIEGSTLDILFTGGEKALSVPLSRF